MKRIIRTIALVAFATFATSGITCPDDPFGGGSSSDDAESDEPSYVMQVDVLVEYIQLDAPVASKLVRKHATEADATTFRDEVQKIARELLF